MVKCGTPLMRLAFAAKSPWSTSVASRPLSRNSRTFALRRQKGFTSPERQEQHLLYLGGVEARLGGDLSQDVPVADVLRALEVRPEQRLRRVGQFGATLEKQKKN